MIQMKKNLREETTLTKTRMRLRTTWTQALLRKKVWKVCNLGCTEGLDSG
jgi:hypothetical protein